MKGIRVATVVIFCCLLGQYCQSIVADSRTEHIVSELQSGNQKRIIIALAEARTLVACDDNLLPPLGNALLDKRKQVRQASALTIAHFAELEGCDANTSFERCRILNAIYTKAPVAVETKPPKYPKVALKEEIEGLVVLEVLIDSRGRVANARVKQSMPHFDKEAKKSAQKWKFEPAERDHIPAPIVMEMTVTFDLLDKR